MPAPVIGLTTYLEQAKSGIWDVPAAFLPHVYFAAVNRAGGIAVLLPPQPVGEGIAERVLDGLDGLIVTGGMDVDPAGYGQAPHPETDAPRPDRDAWETTLLTAALERGVPFLGICRGAQVLNVARGGTLHQHLPDVVGSTRYQPGNAEFGRVEVDIDPTSKLAALVGMLHRPSTCTCTTTRRSTGSATASEWWRRPTMESSRRSRSRARRSCSPCSGTPRNRRTTCGCSPGLSTRRATTQPGADALGADAAPQRPTSG